MADDMKVRNYSQRTIDCYTYHVGKFAAFLGKSPLEATAEDVRSFQLHMIDVRKLKWSSFNQAVCGLRLFFKTTCPQSWHVDMIPFGKRPKKLPAVLSGEEVNRLLSCVKCHKHRTFLLLQYACGLRLNEAAHLKISDIDSQRMQLRVDSGKGQKTRMVPMSPRLLGHASFSTTMLYLHVRTLHLGSAPSPIDWLPIRQLPGWLQPPNNNTNNP
jgi:site-specific recombinase XerD